MVRNIWVFILLAAASAHSQSLDLTVKRYGISFGNSGEVHGVRVNYRDTRLRQVNGLNATIWMPHHTSHGDVRGVALGLPATGARNLTGVGIGLFGLGVAKNIHGISFGLLGLGAGREISGFAAGGLGLGTGGDFTGIGFGGLGLGAGGDATGIIVAGLGLGAGGNVRGLMLAGLGLGASENLWGVTFAGLGAGAGENVTGITVSFGGVGAGGTISGVTVAGLGMGAGEEIKGLAIAGLGLGSPKVTGIAAAMAVGGKEIRALVVAPAYFLVGRDGLFKGISMGAVSQIKGQHAGLSIALLNIANDLHGVQLGLINVAKSNPGGLKVLPIFNAGF